MTGSKLRDFAKVHKSSRVITFFKTLHYYLRYFLLFMATLTGYLPIHTVRLILYRHLFNVDIRDDSIIYCRCRFFKPDGVHIGHHSIIGNDAFLDGRMGLFFGDNVNGGQTSAYILWNTTSPS
jgi:maltose O-acetyltransferase